MPVSASRKTQRRIIQITGQLDLQALNEAFRQLSEMLYSIEGRRGKISLKDQLNVEASQRKTPLRLSAAGRRGSGAFAFGNTENASFYMAKGAYLSDREAWIAEDNVAVILELNRESATPRMFRNTGLTPGDTFVPNPMGYIAIGGVTGDDLSSYQLRAEKDQPSGFAGLDASGEISVDALPDAWDDLRFPATGFNPAGSTAPPSISTTSGLLSFSGTADNIIAGVAQMPHNWKEGTAVYPHLHLRFPTSNSGKNTRWKLEYDVASVNGNFSFAEGTYTALTTITVANPANVNKHVIAAFSTIPMTSKLISACILWRLTRLAASDGADDDTNDCTLIEVDFHYQVDSLGSNAEYVK